MDFLQNLYNFIFVLLNLVIGFFVINFQTPVPSHHSYQSDDPSSKYVFKMFYETSSKFEIPPQSLSGLYLKSSDQLVWAYKDQYLPNITPITSELAFSYAEYSEREYLNFISPPKVRQANFNLIKNGKVILTHNILSLCPKDWSGKKLKNDIEMDSKTGFLRLSLQCIKKDLLINPSTGSLSYTGTL